MASSEDDDWEAIKAKASKYLQKKFNAKVASAFIACCDEYDDLEQVRNDLEKEDEDSWENSGIVTQIAEEIPLAEDQQKLLFNRLRICMGLEEESAESLGIRLLDRLDFKVNPEDLKLASLLWSEQCPNFSGNNDQTMLKLVAIGLKNDVPLLSLLNDLYQIWRLEVAHEDPDKTHVTEEEWVHKSKYLSSLKEKEVKHLLVAGMRSYSRRVLPSPMLRTYQYLNDSVSDYIHIISNMATMVINMAQNSNQQSFPLQVDLWILAKKPHGTFEESTTILGISDDSDDPDDDSDDDDDDDEKKGGNMNAAALVDIGDIPTLLKKDKIKYEKDVINTAKDAQFVRKMTESVNKMIGEERSKRVVMIIDRRETKKEETDYDFYCYKAPKPFGDIDSNYLNEQLMHHTNAYLIAHPDDKALAPNETEISLKGDRMAIGGGFSASHREFCVSFHMHTADNIAMYVWMHGFGVRMLPKHLITILPKYFKNNDLKENGIDQKYLDERLKLKCTDHMFDAWSKAIGL